LIHRILLDTSLSATAFAELYEGAKHALCDTQAIQAIKHISLELNSSTQNPSACTVQVAALTMANPRAAAVILLIMSLFMVVAISRAAAAKPTEGPNKTTALHHDAHGQGMQLHAITCRPSNHPA